MNVDIGYVMDRDILEKTISQIGDKTIGGAIAYETGFDRRGVSAEVASRVRIIGTQVLQQTATVKDEITRNIRSHQNE